MARRELRPWHWFKKEDRLPSKSYEPLWSSFNWDADKLFDELYKDFANPGTLLSKMLRGGPSVNLKILPRMDISETDNEYMIEADLPGVQENDLDISVSKDGILTIKGRRESKEEQKDRNYYSLERSYGSFERSVAIPENCDFDKVAASFKDGILTVTIPKKEPAIGEVKKIKLSNQ